MDLTFAKGDRVKIQTIGGLYERLAQVIAVGDGGWDFFRKNA